MSSGGGGSEFRSFGEQLRSIIAAGTPGQATDPRLFSVRAASGLNEGVGAEGGFLVSSDFSTSLLDRAIEAATLAPRCNSFPIGANANEIKLPRTDETSRANGSRFGGVQLYWSGPEGSDFTPSKPKLGQLTLKPNKLTGLVYLTDEIVQDSTVLEAYVRQCFTSEFSYVIDDVILASGDGVGKPLSVLNSASLVSVAKEAGQIADTIVAENCFKMFARMLPSSLARAIWLVNQSCWPQLFGMQLKVWNSPLSDVVGGAPIFIPGGSIAGAPFGTLLGRPIFPMEQCKALGDKGDIVFADFSRYVLATKGSLRSDVSIHVRFLQDEQVMRFVLRIDGQPEMKSATTPANGSDSLSAFVTLDAR
jgi:HK97 family phage major capsid protein